MDTDETVDAELQKALALSMEEVWASNFLVVLMAEVKKTLRNKVLDVMDALNLVEIPRMVSLGKG